jgi:hypothetical protein
MCHARDMDNDTLGVVIGLTLMVVLPGAYIIAFLFGLV